MRANFYENPGSVRKEKIQKQIAIFTKRAVKMKSQEKLWTCILQFRTVSIICTIRKSEKHNHLITKCQATIFLTVIFL